MVIFWQKLLCSSLQGVVQGRERFQMEVQGSQLYILQSSPLLKTKVKSLKYASVSICVRPTINKIDYFCLSILVDKL